MTRENILRQVSGNCRAAQGCLLSSIIVVVLLQPCLLRRLLHRQPLNTEALADETIVMLHAYDAIHEDDGEHHTISLLSARVIRLETSNFQYQDQSRQVESGHNTGCGLFEPSSAQEQGNLESMSMEESSDPNNVPSALEKGNSESMSMEESIDPNIAPGQVQHGPESAQT
ncbi:hypothetical protein MRX96_039300 [Rhipicephalus microplus]